MPPALQSAVGFLTVIALLVLFNGTFAVVFFLGMKLSLWLDVDELMLPVGIAALVITLLFIRFVIVAMSRRRLLR